MVPSRHTLSHKRSLKSMGPIAYFSASMITTHGSQRYARDALEKAKVVAEDHIMAEAGVGDDAEVGQDEEREEEEGGEQQREKSVSERW